MKFKAFHNDPIIARTTGRTASSIAMDLDDTVDSHKHRQEARNAKRQALVSKRSTSEDLVNERNRAAMMRANATMRTLADNIKVKNQMNAITLAKSANLPSWERLLQIHIANVFPAAVPSIGGTACEVGNNRNSTSTSHSKEFFHR